MQQPPPSGPGTPPIGPQRGSFTFGARHHPYPPPPPHQTPPQMPHHNIHPPPPTQYYPPNGAYHYPVPHAYPPPMVGAPGAYPPYEMIPVGANGGYPPPPTHYAYPPHAPPPHLQQMYMYPHPHAHPQVPPPMAVPVEVPTLPMPVQSLRPGHFITGWKLETAGISSAEMASLITYGPESAGVQSLTKDNLTVSNNWTWIFYDKDEKEAYTVARKLEGNLKEPLEILIKPFKKGLKNILEEPYVFQDGQLKLDPKTGIFQSFWPKPVPNFASKDMAGKSLFTLSTASKGRDWWNFQLQGNYKYITHTFCGRHAAALFMSTTPGEEAHAVYWVMVNGRPYHNNGATDWFWFQPKQFLPSERANEQAKLLLTGDPSHNLFLVASYCDDIHYIYLVSRDRGSNTDKANVTLVQVIANITRDSPISDPNINTDELCAFDIFTYGNHMALYSKGRIASFEVQLQANGLVWSHVNMSKTGNFDQEALPRQLGRFLIFGRVGALDMVTFKYHEFEEGFCDDKYVVWSVQGKHLLASYLDTIDNDGNVIGALGDVFKNVSVAQPSNSEWLRDNVSTQNKEAEAGESTRVKTAEAAIKEMNLLQSQSQEPSQGSDQGQEVEVIEVGE